MSRRRTIRIYYAYRATTSYGFYAPFGTIYLLHQGYGLDVVGLAQSAFLFAMVSGEIPAGYFADRVGRRASLALGNGISAVVLGLYPVVDSAGGWVAIFALWGLGWACHSAIGDAWLYDFLARESDESEFALRSGRAETAVLATSALAALAASLLWTVDPTAPFLANAALAGAGIPLLLGLPATGGGAENALGVREAVEILRVQVRRPEVRWLVAYAALFNVLFSMTRWLEQPALEAVGVPVAGLGVLYAAFKLVSAGATSAAGWIQDRLGPRWFFLLLMPVCGLAYASIAIFPMLVVPVLFLRRALDRISGPIRNQYLNDRLQGVGRATVLSGAAMALNLASGVSNAVVGQIAEATGPLAFLPWAGLVIALAAGVLWLRTSPVRSMEPSAAGMSEDPAPE